MDNIRVISFDADQTLFDFERTMTEALAAVSRFMLEQCDIAVSPHELRATRDRIAKAFETRAIDMLALRQMSFEEILQTHPAKEERVDAAMRIFKEVRFGRVYMYPDVEHVVRALSERFVLAVLTNGNSDPDRTPLNGCFDHIVYGEKFEFKKPDRRIFQHLFDLTKVTDPSEVCHIGDSLSADVAGAVNAGALSIWFNPDRAVNETGVVPVHEIQNMPQLLELFGCV